MEEDIFTATAAVLPWPREQHDFAPVTIISTVVLPSDDLEVGGLAFLTKFEWKSSFKLFFLILRDVIKE